MVFIIGVSIIMWIMSIIITGVVAAQKRRNIPLWCVLAFLFGWIATIVLAFMPDGRSKKCTQCGEKSLDEAIICRMCKTPF